MLQRLTIQNYALIEDLEIEFPDGLIILSGETGAGKSILLGALSLLLGEKADPEVLRLPGRNCVVEAEFSDTALLRRVIAPSGRSRSFYNDEPVTLAVLAEEGHRRIDIHAQHQHLRLSDPLFQLNIIDSFAQTTSQLDAYRKAYAEEKALQEEYSRLQQQLEDFRKEQDFREFQFRQLEEARLKVGELEELEAVQQRLAHAEDLLTGLSQAGQVFQQPEQSLSQALKISIQHLERCVRYLPAIEPLIGRLQSCRIELDDLDQEIQQLADTVAVSPEQLQQVEERLSQLYALLKRYQKTSVEDLIQLRNDLDQSFENLSALEDRLSVLDRQILQQHEQVLHQADALTQARCQVLATLSDRIQAQIRDLEMPYACFDIRHEEQALSPYGKDRFTFLFSANGDRLSEIAKVASGGELSRVMLVLKALLAEYTAMPTLIFDEIDTGVSGKVADRMGELIGEMGHRMQLFAITHLPQIASKPASHYLVSKEYDEDRQAHTRLRLLSASERVEEIARMLSGSQLTAASLANAEELIKLNIKI